MDQEWETKEKISYQILGARIEMERNTNVWEEMEVWERWFKLEVKAGSGFMNRRNVDAVLETKKEAMTFSSKPVKTGLVSVWLWHPLCDLELSIDAVGFKFLYLKKGLTVWLNRSLRFHAVINSLLSKMKTLGGKHCVIMNVAYI